MRGGAGAVDKRWKQKISQPPLAWALSIIAVSVATVSVLVTSTVRSRSGIAGRNTLRVMRLVVRAEVKYFRTVGIIAAVNAPSAVLTS
jgi:hypothetical protein